MMSDEGLVDILLVRLGRDEEKERVKSLLVKELGFSEEEAEQAVAKTPNMIRKAVPMGKGRVIQNRLYPYIDLLPRMDLVDDDESAGEEAEETGQAPRQDEPASGAETEGEPEEEREIEQEVPGLQTAATAVMDAGFSDGEAGEAAPAEPEARPRTEEDDDEDLEFEDGNAPPPPPEKSDEDAEEESEGVVVTSAAEERRQIERCHICGRTPTDGERLAPCRSCGDLTCRDCFDRVAHVCKKCAADGKFVDKPPQRKKKTEREPRAAAARPAAPAAASGGGGGYNRNLLIGIVAALVVLVLLAVGYFVDPLGMFSEGSASAAAAGGTDSLPVAADTASVDTSSTMAADTAAADTLASADTTVTEPVGEPGPLNLAAATLDSAASMAEPVDVPLVAFSGVAGLEILEEDLEAMAEDIGRIASSASIELDAATLFRTESGISVLALSILHPEEDTRRYGLLRGLGHYLAPTGVDELVFYYRENQYYDARVVPYLNSNFPDLSQATGPMEFQELTGCTSAGQWELLNGEVRDWLTSIQR